MKTKLMKTMLSGAAIALGLGLGAQKAAADSFSVSVHTPTVSAGYSTIGGRIHRGYVAAPAPAYCPPPAPVVVYQPPVHVCSYEQHPVTHVSYDRFGCPRYMTTYVTVRVCDDYHRRHDHRYADRHDHSCKHGHRHHDHRDRDRCDRDDRRDVKWVRDKGFVVSRHDGDRYDRDHDGRDHDRDHRGRR